MPAMIRPNRLEVNDRFPMLGFTIRSHGEARQAEVAVGTDPALFGPQGKPRRSPSNFYSSRANGSLVAPRGEVVYVLPSEVLARFVGSQKLYFALATAPAGGPATFTIDQMPTADSPYVSLRALTGRSLRRLRVIPGRSRGPGNGALDWAGDAARPGQQPAERSTVAPAPTPAPSPAHYDDGFGPLPTGATPPAPTTSGGKVNGAVPAPIPASQSLAPASAVAKSMTNGGSRTAASAMTGEVAIGSERRPVTPPPSSVLGGASRIAAEAALLTLSGPVAPLIIALRLAARASAAAGTPVSIGLGPAVSAGLFAGGSLGTGVIFGPGGELGVYGAAQLDVGWVTSISLTAQLTVVRGGIGAFSGWSNSATISGGEELVGGGSALFDEHGNFQGISVQAGIGAGLSPIDMFVSVQRSVSTTLGMAAALGQVGARARAMAGEPRITAGRFPIDPPSVKLLDPARTREAEAMLVQPGPLRALTAAIRLAARTSTAAGTPVSIGLAPSPNAPLTARLPHALGSGVIFGGGGELGVYEGSEFSDIGFVLSASPSARFTVVRGGAERFGSWTTAATITGAEGLAGEASALFDVSGVFQGVSVVAPLDGSFAPVDFFIAAQRAVTTTLGMPGELGQGGARAIDADAIDFDIVYRAFIPSPYIDGPLENYGGDGRGFSVDRGTSRGELHARARVSPGGGIAGFTIINRQFGASHSFHPDGLASPHGKPSWWLEATGDEATVEKDHATLAATNANLNIAPNDSQGGAAQFHVILNGAIPLSRVAPEINSDLRLFIRSGANGWEAKLTGVHDGFPCHELYVNRLPLYQYDPIAADKGPSSLLPPMDIEVDTGWQRLSSVAATADSLEFPPRRTVRAFDADIPLDPGVGGQSIGMDALQVGDIILSTTDAAISRAIRAATSGQVSHAMLYVGQGGQVVEAVGEGVRLVPLGDAIASATVAVAFRVPDLAPDLRQIIADAAATHLGQQYNRIGIARQAVFQIDRRLCSVLPNGLSDRCRTFAGRIDMGTQGNDQFFCSELVLDAFNAAGRPLTSEQPNWASPDDIANLRFDYSKLRYIGHLKAAPSGGLFGHLLDYAKGRPARAMANESYTLNWDEVQLVPQPTDTSCWAAAASMIVGWNELVSIAPSVIARVGASIHFSGQADVSSNTRFAQALGLVAEAPADYTTDGFRQLLENYGPLWVGKVMGSTSPWNASSHAVVVTGMYSDGAETYLRVSDPWDRVVGSPGAPGTYQSSHATGSRYIIKYGDFMREYDGDQEGDMATLHTMILHSPSVAGRTPNRGSAAGVGYAQGYAAPRMAAPPQSYGAARGLANDPPPLQCIRRTETTTRDGVDFVLEQLDGTRVPHTQMVINAPMLPGAISVADWPRMPDDHGGTFGAVKLLWSYGSNAVGDIRVMPENAGLNDGWALHVEGRIVDGPDTEMLAAATVELRHRFTHPTEHEHRSIVRVILRGDGTHDRSNEWELDPVHVGA